MRQDNGPFHPQHFLTGEIHHISRYLTGGQRLLHVSVIDQFAAGKIQDADAVRHHGKRFSIKAPLGIGRQGHMNRYVIAGGINLFHTGGMVDGTGKSPGRIHGQIGIIAVYLSLIHIWVRKTVGKLCRFPFEV